MTKTNQHDNKTNEKQIILNRTLPGRLAAKSMGKLGGRPKKLDAEKIELARKLYDNKGMTGQLCLKMLKISD